ncbi:hypothetical protein HBH53_257690 [Parastagonospora nodorum]|nr:hypothetical protein HBH53_257690 [Parastagonospora nodorum]KAH4215367.1 hypothetical protein HBI06_254900 [Parastagonospora nodorum]KAH4223053.1 hypothetical protein HBI05_251730 [Parastagonospora nodorum]KAH4367569.1 hypothetical protein HBH99_251450 [Parastagonospora nodorum]KAH4890749.1 hypothetical protein HBH74_236860 [Parastagonospora nodorum]
MDWPIDHACLSGNSKMLGRIFKYDPRPSRVIRIVTKNEYRAEVWSLASEEDWNKWLLKYSNQSDRGLILILADRTNNESPHTARSCPMSIKEWLAEVGDYMPYKRGTRRGTTFAPFEEKSHKSHALQDPALTQEMEKWSPRSLLNLPFSNVTFEQICKRFQVHDSVVRTLTRTDVPTFSCDNVEMDGLAQVYNCRTPNSWDWDLALSATHHVQHGLTCAIIYGTAIDIERDILERLQNVRQEAAHPLLVVGIIAELELIRHTGLVDSMINEVEEKIHELDSRSSKRRDHRQIDVEGRNQSKRDVWLNLSYLRNSIITWKTQLLKVIEHAEPLNNNPPASASVASNFSHDLQCVRAAYGQEHDQQEDATTNKTSEEFPRLGRRLSGLKCDNAHRPCHIQDSKDSDLNKDYVEDGLTRSRHKRGVGEKIRSRIFAIIDNYDEKIRDCNMRVDGIAMATQWFQGETAVEIAFTTSQDSRIMRSISLVTMVFLPGTFFATVFSMSFFDWNDEDGKASVSKHLWIYVVVTVMFTAITIGIWYFFVLFRRSRPVDNNKAEMRWD